jgi:PleD family two-component response regulator
MPTNTSETQIATIQIVDDKPENLRLLSSVLVKQGYEVRASINGNLALASSRIRPPDLILLDIMMPEMSGYEVCRQLKADEGTREIPVIFLSALSETLDRVKAFSTGGVDYITKPFQVEEVLARVETHLTIRNLQKELQEKNGQLQERNTQLQEALDNIKTLSGFIPICARCKKIRDDEGYWEQVEVYIRDHTEAEFSHGICPDCAQELYPDLYEK